MGKILQFPKKEAFINSIGSHLPKDFMSDVSIIYDEIILKSENIPELSITVNTADIDAVNIFKDSYTKTMLELLSELLIERVRACAFRHNLIIEI